MLLTVSLSGRALKSGGTISADQAIQCWNAMIDKSPIKNKARIMVGPEGVASPMMTAINFIQHPPSPDNLYAAPMNATVVLGVGAKASDADRYGGKILQKSKEKRPDLNVVTKAVGPFEHSAEYLELLKKHPSISKALNKGKGRLAPDELSEEERLEGKIADKQLYHASDMRDFIDLAVKDPIGLEFLKDFVPHPEDALAVMGILGLNPADQRDDESDQVQEPEINPEEVYVSSGELKETIKQELVKVLNEFINPYSLYSLYKAYKKSGVSEEFKDWLKKNKPGGLSKGKGANPDHYKLNHRLDIEDSTSDYSKGRYFASDWEHWEDAVQNAFCARYGRKPTVNGNPVEGPSCEELNNSQAARQVRMDILRDSDLTPAGDSQRFYKEEKILKDNLSEIIYEELNGVLEGFRSKKTKHHKPSKSLFQRKMKIRLAKAHSTYLDKGRKDLTKYGGGFKMDRPKNISNAFLAEEEIEEMSVAGSIVGAVSKNNKLNNKRKQKNVKRRRKKT